MRRRRSSAVFDSANLDARLRAGLVGHWVGKGSNRLLVDSSGYGRHAVAAGSPSDSRRVIDWSADFRRAPCPSFLGNVFASYDLAHIADLEMSSSGFTVAAWVFVTSTASIQMVISKYPGYYLYVDGTNERASFTYGGVDHFTAFGTVPKNQWVHLLGVHDGGTAYEVYVNGRSLKSGTTALSGTGSPVNIGNYGLTYPMFGRISDLRIYKRALSQAEIALLASPSFTPVVQTRRRSSISVVSGATGNDITGTDAATASDSGNISKRWTITGTDAATASDSGNISKRWTITGADSATASDSGTLTDISSITGSDSTTASDSGNISKRWTITGADSATATDTGNVTDYSYITGADSATASDSGAVIDISSITGTDTATASDSGAVTDVSTIAGTDGAIASDTGTVTDVSTIAGTDGAIASDTGTVSNRHTITGTDEATASDTGTVTDFSYITGTDTATASDTGDVSVELTGIGGTDSVSASDAGALQNSKLILGSDSAEPSDTGILTDISSITGTDTATASDSGAVTDYSYITGADSATASDAGTLTDISSITGTDSATASDTGTVTDFSYITGTDTATASDTGAVIDTSSIVGTDSATASDTGAVIDTSSIVGTDSATASDSGALTDYSYITGTDTATASDSGTVTDFSYITGADSATASDSGSVIDISSITGSDSIVATDALSVYNEKPIVGVDVATAINTGDIARRIFIAAETLEIVSAADTGALEVTVDNPYLDWWSSSPEQDLYQSLTTESIQFFGQDVIYIPRAIHNEDTLYNEDVLSAFENVYTIESQIMNVFGWEGLGSQLTRFGVRLYDKLTLRISRERFAEVFANASPAISRPMEGDLIYLPAPMDALFEISHVKHERASGQFYPLGKLLWYELELNLHTYNQEAFNTGNTAIDTTFETDQKFQTATVDSANEQTDSNRYLSDEADLIVATG